ncbi:MAG: hypothetical protein AB7P04_09000 [Bacteriovoracia bacterium]
MSRGFALVVIFAGLSLVSCHSEKLEEVCAREFVQFKRGVDAAKVAFVAEPSRAIASVPSPPSLLGEDDWDRWKDWSVDALRDVQAYLDVMENYPERRDLKRELSQLANELVAFYGIAERRDRQAISRTALDIHRQMQSVERGFCAKP